MRNLIAFISLFVISFSVKAQNQFSPYVPKTDVNLYNDQMQANLKAQREVGKQLEKAYRQNVQEIGDLIAVAHDLNLKLYELNYNKASEIDSSLSKYVTQLNQAHLDLGQFNIAQSVKDQLNSYIRQLKYYNNLYSK